MLPAISHGLTASFIAKFRIRVTDIIDSHAPNFVFVYRAKNCRINSMWIL